MKTKITFLCLVLILFTFSCSKKNSTNPENHSTETAYSGIPAIEDIVMYEINPRALSTSGDFKGVIDRLDHIQSLGINVIWFMPIHPIGQVNSVNSPYAVQDYRKVNPEFGTLQDFQTLIDKAHDRDMAVIIDWVGNHTAWDHPWMNSPTWYRRNASGEIIHPPGTNWQDVADLNFDNAEMRLAMIDAMKFWVTEIEIDGFRCDAADMVPFDFWQQAIDSLQNIDDNLLLLAEGARDDHFDAGFDMNYGWHFYSELKKVYHNQQNAYSLFQANTVEYNDVPQGKQMLRFTTNHDESAWDATPVELFGGIDGSLSAFVITTFLQGVPLVYGSQEVGTARTISFFDRNPIDWTQNPEVLETYQQLLAFYNASPAARTGTLQTYRHDHILAFTKTAPDGEQLLFLVNTRRNSQTYTLPTELANTTWTNVMEGETVNLGTQLDCPPYQYYILKK